MMSTLMGALSIRERLVAQAVDFTVTHGWSSLTMAKLADRVGVSRQTVYNELGNKPALAEAMVLRELESFLKGVDEAFAAHPDDLVVAIGSAAESALTRAADNPLLHAVLTSYQGAESDLLPLLTTHSEMVLGAAGQMIRAHVSAYDVSLAPDRLERLVDTVVRLVLSHVMQPGGQPKQIAEDIAWIAGRVLDQRPLGS
jgi:AcrR family transcriptional regulator